MNANNIMTELKDFISTALAAGVTKTDSTSAEAVKADSVFQTATILNARITPEASTEAIQATIEALAVTEKNRFDAAICTLDVLAEHASPKEEMRKFGDIANRAQAAMDWLEVAMTKLGGTL